MECSAVLVGVASSSKAHVRIRSASAALPAGMPSDGNLCILGLVLAAGIRFVLPRDRAIGFRVYLRPAAVLVEAGFLQAPLSALFHRLSHQTLPFVPTCPVFFSLYYSLPPLFG